MPTGRPNALWVQEEGRDFIVFVEQDDDGGRNLLRVCYAEREGAWDLDQAHLCMRGDGKCFAVSEQQFGVILGALALEDYGPLDEWEETIVMTFGANVVEMKSSFLSTTWVAD